MTSAHVYIESRHPTLSMKKKFIQYIHVHIKQRYKI